MSIWQRRRYIKKLVSLAALGVLVLALAGCRGNEPRTVKVEQGSGYSINTYDENDRCVRTELYSRQDILTQTVEYRSEGTRMKNTYYNADGSVHTVHEYNGKEVCIKTTEYSQGQPVKYGEYEYDRYGTRLRTVWYNMEGVKLSMQEFENSFDLMCTTIYNPDGTVKELIEYK